MLFVGVLLFGCAGTPELPGWYVAPDGDDANEGRGKTPLKTIAKPWNMLSRVIQYFCVRVTIMNL